MERRIPTPRTTHRHRRLTRERPTVAETARRPHATNCALVPDGGGEAVSVRDAGADPGFGVHWRRCCRRPQGCPTGRWSDRPGWCRGDAFGVAPVGGAGVGVEGATPPAPGKILADIWEEQPIDLGRVTIPSSPMLWPSSVMRSMTAWGFSAHRASSSSTLVGAAISSSYQRGVGLVVVSAAQRVVDCFVVDGAAAPLFGFGLAAGAAGTAATTGSRDQAAGEQQRESRKSRCLLKLYSPCQGSWIRRMCKPVHDPCRQLLGELAGPSISNDAFSTTNRDQLRHATVTRRQPVNSEGSEGANPRTLRVCGRMVTRSTVVEHVLWIGDQQPSGPQAQFGDEPLRSTTSPSWIQEAVAES